MIKVDEEKNPSVVSTETAPEAGDTDVEALESMCARYETLNTEIKLAIAERDALGQRIAEIAIPLNVGDHFTVLGTENRDAQFHLYAASDVFQATRVYMARSYSGIATPRVNAQRKTKTGKWSELGYTFTNDYEFRAALTKE